MFRLCWDSLLSARFLLPCACFLLHPSSSAVIFQSHHIPIVGPLGVSSNMIRDGFRISGLIWPNLDVMYSEYSSQTYQFLWSNMSYLCWFLSNRKSTVSKLFFGRLWKFGTSFLSWLPLWLTPYATNEPTNQRTNDPTTEVVLGDHSPAQVLAGSDDRDTNMKGYRML